MTQRNKRRSAEKPTAVKFDRSDSGMAGGVLILGGIVAVGAVAGAIAALRRKTSNKTDDEYGKRGDGNSKRTPRENGNGGGLRSLLQIHGKQFSPVQSPDDDAPHEGYPSNQQPPENEEHRSQMTGPAQNCSTGRTGTGTLTESHWD
ncbi:hypothetical protein AMTR_s00003p00130600 [Amborella trichopoda]|uniref:Uncharacterized protein n=1 Tax=Amborella trichopoda TaxID=13333 RepID=W1P6I0_AMBTC|nr:hypothetical protein AMTR_s00003p00130600 [Amborella trichopoda]